MPIVLDLGNNMEITVNYGETFNDYDYKVFECGLFLFGFCMDDLVEDKDILKQIIKRNKEQWNLN